MNKSLVSVVICKSYEENTVYSAVKAGVDAIGGIDTFVKKNEKILIKPNFIYPAEAERALTTHPSVIKAACRLLSENGYAEVMVGDSPGNGSCKAAAKRLNLSDDTLYGAKVVDMSSEKTVRFPEGRVCKSFHFTEEVAEAEAIIGLCKMKTHMLERITGGVKNMYGLICGHRKALGHVSYPTAVKFAKLLTDIHRATPQRLHIMDGIVAMEGNGPTSGSPIDMNVIIASSDPVAMDTVFCWLIDLAPHLVPTNIQGERAGIGTFKEENIEIRLVDGDDVSVISKDELVKRLGNPAFDVVREEEEKKNPLSILSNMAGGRRRPVIDESKCVKCGICVNHCPVEGKAVDFKNGKENPPVYNYKKCIRCYCCQEMCPQKAISVKR